MKEGGGGDGIGIAATLAGQPAIADNDPAISGAYFGTYISPDRSIITITQQPQDTTVDGGKAFSFTVAATGASDVGGTVSYQWQKNGADIAGATGATLNVGAAANADNGAKFACILSVPGKALSSSTATLTVIPDTVSPTIASVVALAGNGQVIVVFSELVDQATVANLANYGVSGATVTDVSVRPDGKTVVLSVVGLVKPSAYVAVKGIKDLSGNAIAAAAVKSGPVMNLTSRDIGTQDATTYQFTNPLEPGSVTPLSGTDFDVVAGGTDIWDNSDGFHFVYEQRTGDFDITVQVARLDIANNWSKAGLMAREKLTGNSRNVNLVVDPTGTTPAPDGSGTGANVYESNGRTAEGGSSANWATASSGVPYPNAWMRLTRVGDVFTSYRGTNGVNWTQLGTTTPSPAYPATVYVGMATTAHNNSAGHTTYAQFRNYKSLPAAGAPDLPANAQAVPSLNIVRDGAVVMVSWPVTAEGYVLQTRDGLSAEWADVSALPAVDGDQYTVAVQAEGMQFFQLRRQ